MSYQIWASLATIDRDSPWNSTVIRPEADHLIGEAADLDQAELLMGRAIKDHMREKSGHTFTFREYGGTDLKMVLRYWDWRTQEESRYTLWAENIPMGT